MAKKLNKKIAVIGIVLLTLMIAAGSGLLIYRHIRRDPDRALKLHQQALDAGDYLEAERQLGRAYVFGKTDEDKTQRLFELADFHLIQNDEHEANWGKAMQCWNMVITNTDTQNIPARRKLLDYYYQAADTGDTRIWKNVNENTTELLEILEKQGTEPDTFLLTAHARSLLGIAQRGETTDRREPLNASIEILSELLEKEPGNEKFYKLMADATIVEGELNALGGVVDAEQKAQEKAVGFLETAVEQADDKSTATADLILYKMQTAQNDPNSLEAIRVEIAERSKQVQPNDKLWLVTSIAYETPGQLPAEAEINRAIEAIRQAHELKPDNFEYTFRLARLMYRKGNAFNDSAALEDARQMAEGALSLPEVQDVPGPLQGRNLMYRFTLNGFLADLYLENAIAAKEAENEVEAQDYLQKAEPRVKEILDRLGATDNPTAQKYQGMIALVRGEKDEAVRLLYKAYEQSKALDTPGEASNVDPRVAVILAEIAKQEGNLGLQAEFLLKVYTSGEGYVQQKPQIFLEYAQLINRLRSFPGWAVLVMQSVDNYEKSCGANEQSRKLAIEVSLATGELDKAKEMLAYFDNAPEAKLSYELRILLVQIRQLRQTMAGSEEEKKEPTAEQTQELETLRASRDALLEQILSRYPKEMDSLLLNAICIDLMQNEQAQRAVQYLDTYLAANPDSVDLMVLRLRAQQADPLNLTTEQLQALQEQAIQAVSDPKQKALLLAGQYRSSGDDEKALKILEENPEVDKDDPDIVKSRFEIVLEQKDLKAAEGLLPMIRTKNLDLCEGNLAVARLEYVKENYPLALRRMEECVTLRPLSSDMYYYKSLVQRQLEDQEAAIESAQTAVRMNPKNPIYARNLASLLFVRNAALGSKMTTEQREEAQRAIGMALSLNPTDWQLRSVYAESIQKDSPDRALAIRQRLLKSNPTAANAMMLGNMALRIAQSEWEPAKKDALIELAGKAYQQGMEIDPDDEMLRQTFADYQQRTGKGEDAIKLLKDDKNLEWKFYLRNGQFGQAEAVLKDLLQETPDDTALVKGLVLALQGAGKRDDVKRYLDMLSGLDDTKETGLWILQKYIDNGFVAEAEKDLASFKERYPDEKVLLLVEAWTEMGKGRLEEALVLANRYLETDTNNAGAWRLRGRLYRLMNRPREAIADLQHSKLLQDAPAVRLELATVYRENNQVAAAIGELVSGLEDPQSPVQIRLTLESLYQQNNRTGDLEKLYRSTLEKYPESSFWHFRAGRFYLTQKNLQKAQELLQKSWDLSVESNSPNADVLNYYLESFFQAQQYDKVMSIASGLIDTPLAPIAYGFMAQIQLRLEQKEKAVESFGKALTKCESSDSALEGIMYLMLGTVGEEAVTAWISKELSENKQSLKAYQLASILAERKGLYNEAIEHVDKCIEISGEQGPDRMRYAQRKSNLLLMGYAKTADQGYLTRAIELLEQMIQVQPNNSSLLNNMAYLLIDNDRQLETALEYARRAHQRDPGNGVYLDTYAYAQCKTGQYKQAEQNLIRAAQIYEESNQPVPWDLYEHLGMAKEGLGNTSEAIEMYQKALDASDQIPEKETQELQQAIQRLQQS
ncbi:MAG: tetratricopeptide repeat protein [Planctomycetota bacterium]|jgi:tetratricopeptide (TPR) repeat protein